MIGQSVSNLLTGSGAVSGAIGGMGSAAVYGGDIAKGAWQGAVGGAAVGGIMWAKNAMVTEQFLQKHVAWGSSTSSADQKVFSQAIREAGQSPRGQVQMFRFMQQGRTLTINAWNVANAQATLGGNEMWLNPNAQAYKDPQSSSPWARTFDQATVFLHEFGHNLGYSDYTGNPPHSDLNVAYNENPHRVWTGSPSRTEYGAGLPTPRTFGDIDIWG